MNFETWLIKQKDRNDPIGDLANDYIQDGKPKEFTYEYLCSKTSYLPVLKTYKKARKEWEKFGREPSHEQLEKQ